MRDRDADPVLPGPDEADALRGGFETFLSDLGTAGPASLNALEDLAEGIETILRDGTEALRTLLETFDPQPVTAPEPIGDTYLSAADDPGAYNILLEFADEG